MDTVKIERMSEDVILPKYETDLAVGMDLRSNWECDLYLYPNQIAIIDTGIKIQLPDHLEAQIRSRSGLSTKGIIVVNAPGTIDPDYTGEIKIILTNISNMVNIPFIIKKGDRIAQMVFAPIVRVKLEEATYLQQTQRGEGGFGSTGVK